MSSEGERAWAQAVAFTRDRSPASFDQWFSGVQFDGFTDGVLCLRARDEFVRQWVEDYFLPTMTDWLRAHTALSVQVRVEHRRRARATRRGASVVVRAGEAARDLGSRPRRRRRRRAAVTAGCGRGSGHVGRRASFAVPPPIEGLNPKYTFANFVVGPSNQLAHAAAIAAAGGGGRRYNPLFICGGTGLGKTHLVHADRAPRPRGAPERAHRLRLGRALHERVHPGAPAPRMDEFRARYRERCDLLLVDDIQFLAGREQTQEEFFHTFNALHQADKQIVVTSDKYPQQLERMEERLVSRFSWGLVADIQVPELETRVAIVRKKAQIEQHRARRRRRALPRAERSGATCASSRAR